MVCRYFWFILYVGMSVVNQGVAEDDDNSSPTCEKIRIPFCEGIPYNYTGFPNALNHTTQAEAALELNKYQHILETGCSPDLKFLLCSLFLPMCKEFEVGGAIPNKKGLLHAPCRSLCRRGADPCEFHLLQSGLVWTANGMGRCEDFPEFEKIGDHSLCIGEPEVEANITIKSLSKSGATGKLTCDLFSAFIFFSLTLFYA